jgi:hypothetical protein
LGISKDGVVEGEWAGAGSIDDKPDDDRAVEDDGRAKGPQKRAQVTSLYASSSSFKKRSRDANDSSKKLTQYAGIK